MKTLEFPNKHNVLKDMSITSIDYVITNGACFFSEKRHESLLRCEECRMKFEPHKLKYVLGKIVCKFCAGGIA